MAPRGKYMVPFHKVSGDSILLTVSTLPSLVWADSSIARAVLIYTCAFPLWHLNLFALRNTE